jgi:hypothetical protein
MSSKVKGLAPIWGVEEMVDNEGMSLSFSGIFFLGTFFVLLLTEAFSLRE